MNRVCSLLLAAAACSAGGSAQHEFDGQRALQYVATQLEFGPRVPNTDGHRRAGDWLLLQLRERADSVEAQAFRHVTRDGDTLRLRNFIARFRPEVTERVVYLAHWDTRPFADKSANLAQQRLPVPGANDGASGVAVLLGVGDALLRQPPAHFGVDLVFVDGEDYGDFGTQTDVLLGAARYAQSVADASRPLFAVVWDMVGDRDLQIFQEYNSAARAPEIVDRLWRVAEELGYGRTFRPTVGYTVTDDHLPLLDAGIRAIDVIDMDYPYHHTTEDTLDKVSAESLQRVGDVAVALLR